MENDKTTTELKESCREESKRYQRKGHSVRKGTCYELFRRAIVDKDEEAWAAVYEQYKKLVVTWVQTGDNRVDDLVNDTFMRFFKAIKPDTFVQKFAGIGKVMAFLRLCAQSAKIDMIRKQKKAEIVSLDDANIIIYDAMTSNVLDRIQKEEVLEHLQSRLKDDQERLLYFLSFESGLKPRQIAAKYKKEFADVKEVRRIKERIVLRLKKDPQLRILWNALN